MSQPILYSFRRCPYAMRARMAIYLANISCELREISLRNKPQAMLEISPKGTVPVLQLQNAVIEESMQIVNWAFLKNSNSIYTMPNEEMQFSKSMIGLFDGKFKYHLDRYKYYQRYNSNYELHRVECDKILHELDANVSKSIWFFSDRISLLDIAILPFIRQFKIANPEYFFNQSYQNIIKLLESFENSEIFESVMQKYDLWRPQGSSKPVLFPS